MLLIGVDTTTPDVIKYCRSRQIYMIITDYNSIEKSPVKRFSDEAWQIDVKDLDTLEEKCRTEGITSVYAGNHDLLLEMQRNLCKRLSFPYFASDRAWSCTRNKNEFKQLCIECGIDIPFRYSIDSSCSETDLDQICYPVVVKPSDSTAGKGFSVVRSREEFSSAYAYALRESASRSVIVEEYLTGQELDAMYFVDHGEVHLTALMENLTVDLNGVPFIGLVADECDELYKPYMRQLNAKVKELIRRLDFTDGYIFFQLFYQSGKFCMLEMNARIDGIVCYRTMAHSYGFNSLSYALDYLRGLPVKINWSELDLTPYGHDNMHYIIYANPGTVSHVEGMEYILQHSSISLSLVRFKPGDIVTPTGNLTQAAFYLTIFGKEREDTIRTIRFINDTLKLIDTDGNNLLVFYSDYEHLRNRP